MTRRYVVSLGLVTRRIGGSLGALGGVAEPAKPTIEENVPAVVAQAVDLHHAQRCGGVGRFQAAFGAHVGTFRDCFSFEPGGVGLVDELGDYEQDGLDESAEAGVLPDAEPDPVGSALAVGADGQTYLHRGWEGRRPASAVLAVRARPRGHGGCRWWWELWYPSGQRLTWWLPECRPSDALRV